MTNVIELPQVGIFAPEAGCNEQQSYAEVLAQVTGEIAERDGLAPESFQVRRAARIFTDTLFTEVSS